MSDTPGWRDRDDMPGMVDYWTGDAWANTPQPSFLVPDDKPKDGPSTGRLVFSVAAGIVVVIMLAWFVHAVATAGDDTRCEIENIDRSISGEPATPCD